MEIIFYPLAGPCFSLDSLHCVTLAPSDYLHSSQPQSSPWGSTPKAWVSASSPPVSEMDTSVWVTSPLGFAIWQDLCGECSPFCFQSTCHYTWSSLCTLPVREFPSVWKFSPFMTAFLEWRSLSPNSLFPFISLSFALPHSEEIGLPFWNSGVLCQCSEDVL